MNISCKTMPWLILISALLTGCASGRVPQTGPTMADMYKNALTESDGNSLATVREQIKAPVAYQGKTELIGYTRTAQNEVNQLFSPLPNPPLVMYVYPHLVADEALVPGYTTAFYLFEQNHYALPGEVA